MGTKNRRLTRFLAKNPFCCYCGGDTPATTEDHWPPRTVFIKREWPQGYVFPACDSCQRATSNVEGMFGLICRLAPGDEHANPVAQEELEKQVRGQMARHPELMQALKLSNREKRTILRDYGAQPEPGQLLQDVPILTLRHPETRQLIETCFKKLLLSLHYMHTETVLPKHGVGYLQWFSNGQKISEEAFDGAIRGLRHRTELKRAKVDLSAQFSYRYAVSNDKCTSAFIVAFGESLGALGFLCNDRSQISESTGRWKVEFRPFESARSTAPV